MITPDASLLLLGLAAILLAIAARAVSVLLPLTAMRPLLDLGPLGSATLIGRLARRHLDRARAEPARRPRPEPVALAATYAIVLFSVIVQGGTIERVLQFVQRRQFR